MDVEERQHERIEGWEKGDASVVRSKVEKNPIGQMPDLVQIDASSVSPEPVKHSHNLEPQESLSDTHNGPTMENSISSATVSRAATPVTNSTGEAKKKTPVDSLSRDELLQQVKKQMILLQKTKTRYDELQQKFTSSEEQRTAIIADRDSLKVKLASVEPELEKEKETSRKLREQQTARSSQLNSVAELELRDYERTISQLNEKLGVKDEVITRSAEQTKTLEDTLELKQRDLFERDQEITELKETREKLEDDLTGARRDCLEQEKVINGLRTENDDLRQQIRDLERSIQDNTKLQSSFAVDFARAEETIASQNRAIQQKAAEVAKLQMDLNHSHAQHSQIMQEFDDYKKRAQVMLRQQKEVAEAGKREQEFEEMVAKVAEMEAEVRTVRMKNKDLETEAENGKRVEESMKRSFDLERLRFEKILLEREERIRDLESILETRNAEHRRQVQLFEAELANMKDLHVNTNERLLDEIHSLRAKNESLRQSIQQAPSPNRLHSVSDQLNTSFDLPNNDLSERLSESPHSSDNPLDFPPTFSRTLSQSASEIVHIPPLDRLLSSQSQSDITSTTSTKEADLKLMKHLTDLLHESEGSNVRLNEQIKVLKQELRRIEANAERSKHVDSMEYLKNVLMKFLTRKLTTTEQEKLVEVMTTILKLNLDERQQLLKAASASYIPENIKAWGSYLNPWKVKE